MVVTKKIPNFAPSNKISIMATKKKNKTPDDLRIEIMEAKKKLPAHYMKGLKAMFKDLVGRESEVHNVMNLQKTDAGITAKIVAYSKTF